MSSLYTICLDRIYGFLKEGMWKSWGENPFLDLPTKFVNELMDLSDGKKDYPEIPKIGDVFLLLTSGRLTRLNLCPFNLKKEQDLIIQKTGRICSSNLAPNSEELIFDFVRNIISWNPYLEEFHSKVHPGFEVFLKCPNLRVLKIYNPNSKFLVNNAPIDLSVLSSLRNLEVLHIFYMDTDMTVKVLETCPKLISIGRTDSLDSLAEIAQRQPKNSFLNLRRCVWGKEYNSDDPKERQEYDSRFGGMIRSAVELCPLVRELILHVHQKDGYEALRFLKQLTLLRIHLKDCSGDTLPEMAAILQEIGPQLEHLSVFGKNESSRRNYPVPVDVICDCCPHLQSLEIWGAVCMRDSSKSSSDLALKTLKLWVENEEEGLEGLLFLLYNSKNLEELSLEGSPSLDDTSLNQIFQRNPFSQLKVSHIEGSGLTDEGFQMFLEKVPSIETVLILSDREDVFYDEKRFKDPNLRYPKDLYAYVKLNEFFYCRLDGNRF